MIRLARSIGSFSFRVAKPGAPGNCCDRTRTHMMKRSAPPQSEERIGPFGVAGIGERLAASGQPDGGRWRAGLMDHFSGAHRESEHLLGNAWRDLPDRERKPPLGLAEFPEKNTSIAAMTRFRVPGGPTTVSGRSRRR